MNITIPIIWVKKSMYLVGNKIISIEKKGEYVTAHIGGGYSKLTEYLQENHYKIEKDLVYKMIQSQQSLEWICESMMNGNKIQSSRLLSARADINSLSKKRISPRLNDSKASYRLQDTSINFLGRSNMTSSQDLQLVRKEVEEDSTIRDVMKSPRRSYSKQKKGISPNRFTKVSPRTPIKVMRDNSQSGMRSLRNLTTRSSTKQLVQAPSPANGKNQSFHGTTASMRLNQQQIIDYDQKRKELMKKIEDNEAEKQMMLDDLRPKGTNGKYSYIHTQINLVEI